jgi:class 3 adenylate cyclase
MTPGSLRARITLALLALALVPLAVATLFLVRLNLDRLRTSAKEYRMAVAADVVRAARTTLDRARTELEEAAADLAAPEPSPDARLARVRTTLLGARFVDEVALYDRSGAHVETFSARDPSAGIRRPDELSPPDLAALARDGHLLGEVVVQDGRARVPLAIRVHQGPDKALWGYVRGWIDLQTLSREVSDASRARFSGKGDRVFVIDARYRVVAHDDPRLLLASVRDRGIAVGVGEDALRVEVEYAAEYAVGDERLLGVLVPIPEVGWGVVVEQERAVAYAGVRTTWQTALAVGAGFALMAIGLGLWLGGRLARPVSAVAAAAGRVAAGDFDVRIAVTGRDEVARMARSFNRMTADLSDYRARLVEETRVRTNLSRYLSPEVVDLVVAHRADLKLGGERREVTVLFADIVSFTPLAERADPERVVAILNELFTFLTEIVFRNGGMVDKFIGDCVMGVFGVPASRGDDAVRAVRAADEMLRWLDVGNARWRAELGTDLRLGIGLNTGVALAGNIGSEKRMEYTVIGDVVNVAAHLESLARPDQILMTRETMERVAGEFPCVRVASQVLRGRQQATEIFTLAE